MRAPEIERHEPQGREIRPMRNPWMMFLLLSAAGGLSGCNKSAAPGKEGSLPAPTQAVGKFLQSICAADRDGMFALLTDEARTALKAHNMSPQLPSSGTTSFELGQAELVD